MYLVVGLGNPEGEYSNSRHNMGFDTINKIAEKLDVKISREKYKGLYGETTINNEKVILLKPQTYMNLSGDSIIQFKNFYKIPDENIIIIYDDMDIEKGNIKIRKKGGPGSHNGMKSVIDVLNTDVFPRIRIGIGRPMFKEMTIAYVLEKISKEEREILDKAIDKAADATIDIIEKGIDKTMNMYN